MNTSGRRRWSCGSWACHERACRLAEGELASESNGSCAADASRSTITVEAGRGTSTRASDAIRRVGTTIVVDGRRRPGPERKNRGIAPRFRCGPAVEAEDVGLQTRGRGDFVSLAGREAHVRFAAYRRALHGGETPLRAIVEGEALRLALEPLIPFAHWVTPPVDTRRFDTRFFMTRVPPNQTPAHDETETTESAWLTAADALDRCRRGDIVLPPPTWTTLREIEPFASVEAALAWARTRRIQRREPKFVEDAGIKMLLLPGDPLNPEPSVEPAPHETRFILTNGRWRAEAVRT